ncbi:MAG: class I SAM-dependent methyltransferase [Planctomycetota bacterium]|jgi:SAM-dependent methyltransferase
MKRSLLSRHGLNQVLRSFGWEIRRAKRKSQKKPAGDLTRPAAIDPVWPLPRRPGGLSEDEIRAGFARHETILYPYEFEGGLRFWEAHAKLGGRLAADPEYFAKRYRHFMPYLLQSQGGSLEGKRILDIACSSGYWAIQCALLGAEVVAFEARPEQIELANLVKSAVGLTNVDFRVMDYWDMSPERLGGKFDLVLNLGILYHLPNSILALERTFAMAKKQVLLDTAVYPADGPLIKLQWDRSEDIRSAVDEGVAALPSKAAVEMMLQHVGAKQWFELPIDARQAPERYINGQQASWLITV